jgi:RimJ/RimL family protein N-acetyltransferase
MSIFTSIETERLSIRRLTSDDIAVVSRYRSLPEVAKYQSWDQFSEIQARKLVEQMQNSEPDVKGQWFQFGIELVWNKKLIGDIGFLLNDSEGKSWIGFTLDEKYWNQGYASESVSAVLNYYQELGVVTTWASMHPNNEASGRLLERLGFIFVEIKAGDKIFTRET